ncbi:hypothetical protein ACQ4WP_18600 [Janthinobacterium sp. GB4P2]|uniref:hypothetical protein n=1 Tax=Janthinobacterium sp. GB4P2 TaxID=3424189 RepID=UPI003F21380A
MQRFHLLLLAMVSFSPVVYAQSAQPASTSAAVADANATVPPLKYVSAFADVKPIGEPPISPDKAWIQANQDVTGGAQGDMSMEMVTGEKGQENPKPPSASDPHKGHQMNMKGK